MARRWAVVFDLDGTLVDSAPDLQRVLNDVLAADGLPVLDRETVVSMIGGGVANLVRRGYAAAGRDLEKDALDDRVATFVETYARDPVQETHAYEGVETVLRQLRENGYRLAVCTNKTHHLAVAVLERLGLHQYFEAVVGGDVLPQKKPDPAPLLAALKELGAAPGEAVLVGDGPPDAEMARRAGVPVILMRYGYSHGPAEDLQADLLLHSFAEVPGALARLMVRT